jgi:uncharacterized protein YhaN
MRFSELRLIKYGHFDSCTLTFPAGQPDLQFIYGPNEAGKTTTLSAIRDLLFGFGRKTTQDYRFDRTLLRVGAVISGEGEDLVLRRRKGDVRTLLDETESPLPDSVLVSHLHGYDADAFERMFSLDHTRLRRGGSEIVAGEGAVGEAIFSAGAGLAGVARLCDELDEEAKGIWARTQARDRRYYVAQAAYEEARGRLRQAQVKPAKWDSARREFERAAAAVDAAQAEFERTLAEHDTVERKRRLVLPVSQLLERRRSLSELRDVPELPADAGETCRSCLADIETAGVRRRVASEALEDAARDLAGLAVPEALVAATEQVEVLRERKSVIADYVSDLPRRRAKRDSHLARLRALQAELEWPPEGATETRARLPARTKSAEVRELVERRAGLDARLAAARRATTQASEDITRLSARRDALGPPVDVAAPAVTLRRLRTAGDLDAAVVKTRRGAAQLAGQLSTALELLAPWSGTAAELRVLPLPDEAEVSAASEALERTRRDAELAAAAVLEAGRRVEAARLALRQAIEAGDPVLPEAVAEARASRDEIWSGLRRSLLDRVPLADPPAEVSRYEEEVRSVDQLSDRRDETSEAAALALARRRDLEEAELNASHARTASEEASRKRSEALDRWRALIGLVGVELDVAGFQAWRGRAREALALTDRLQTAEAEVGEAEGALRAAVTEAAALAGELGLDAGAKSIATVLDEVDARIGKITAANAERASLGREIEAAETAATRAAGDVAAAEADLAEWEKTWTARVAEANLGEGARFSLVRERLTLLEEVREITGGIVDLERRIQSMEQEVSRFSGEVDALALATGVRLPDGADSLTRLAALLEALEVGRKLDRRRTELISARDQATAASAAADAEIRTAEARLKPLLDVAGVSKPRDLIPVVERTSRARALSAEIAQLEDQVLAAAGGGEVSSLVELVRAADAVQLKAESERIRGVLDHLRAELQQLSEEKQRHEIAFLEIDDGPDAAAAEADMVQAKAEMEFQAEAYVERRAEALLLRWAVERFRRERQAPLLREASEIFSRLTLGRYAGLDVEMEGKDGQLIGLLSDGSRAVPAALMSDGTADQLYLALRLAAVREAVGGGARLPFVADDLFINYDDERAAAGFREIAELATVTQVLFLTHHEHLLEVAGRAIAPLKVSSCTLGLEPVVAASAAAEAAAS